MVRVLVQLLNMRPSALSGLIVTQEIVPPLVRALGEGNVVLLADDVARRHVSDPGCEWDLHAVPDERIAKNLALRMLLPAAVRRHRADVVYVPEGPLIGAPLAVPATSTLHSHMNFSRPAGMWLPRRIYWEAWANRIYRRDLQRSAALFAPTRAFADELSAIVPGLEDRLVVVHHGVSRAFAADATVARRAAVLHVGNDMIYKNLAGALRIFARAAADLPHELRVAGPTKSAIERIALDAGVAHVLSRVVALGRLEPDRLAVEYRQARALLMPSLVESFGLPVAEAMASGLPVACSDLPAMKEVAAGAALHCDPSDEEAFARELRRLLVDDALAARLGAMGLRRAQDLSWDRAAGAVAEQLVRVGGHRALVAAGRP